MKIWEKRVAAEKQSHVDNPVHGRCRVKKGRFGMLALTGAMVSMALVVSPSAWAEGQSTGYYSSKQPYAAPSETSYSQVPEGYHLVYTEAVARHGSRGLSSYKYDALLSLMAQSAAENNYAGFVSPQTGKEFIDNLNAITAANVSNGYGMLTGQGALQHQGIGARAYQRDEELFADAAARGLRISYQSSGEARATESGENFKRGFDQVSNGLLSNAVVTPDNPADTEAGKYFKKNPNTLYFHQPQNPDGSEKTGEAKQRADRYQQFVEQDEGIATAEDAVMNDPSMTKVSHDLLAQIFTPEFLSSIGTSKGKRSWYNTADGSKKGAVHCAAGSDPAKDPNACGEEKKKIASEQDAAMDLYNLYIIAADMQQENTGTHTFDFNQYFQGQHAQDAQTFAWTLDAEDFYEKGPSRVGQNETYRIAQPLLDDFFNAIDTRNQSGTVATFRFAHAETIIPFAALLKLPGSQKQATDVYTYANNPWRGESVTPMAANVQWDVAARDGKDTAGQDYQPLIRMLYNEQEIAFNDSCTPIAEGSTWYKESELKSCLNGKGTTSNARLASDETPDGQKNLDSGNSGNSVQQVITKPDANKSHANDAGEVVANGTTQAHENANQGNNSSATSAPAGGVAKLARTGSGMVSIIGAVCALLAVSTLLVAARIRGSRRRR